MTRRIAIFAHWDKDNLIDDYVVYYLSELKKVADIIFASDCDLPQNELEKVTPLVLKSIARKHGEYDFGSYKRGFLDSEDILPDYDELIFANDSCYGPFFPFNDIWKKMESVPCDYWGLFKHLDPKINIWHIQSYFVVFKKQVFTSSCFSGFMNGISKENSKDDVILKYEIGLSDTLEQAGFQSISLCPQSFKNETHQKKTFDLIRGYKLPLLKKAFLAANPCHESFVYRTIEDLETFLTDKYPCQLIENNLRRTASKNFKDGWFHPDLRKITLIHKKFIRIKEKSAKYFCYFTIKIFGLSVFILPSRFLFHRWLYERKKRKTTSC